MTDKQPLLLLPGLLCDPILWAHQTEYLADIADMTVADLTRHDNRLTHALARLERAFDLAELDPLPPDLDLKIAAPGKAVAAVHLFDLIPAVIPDLPIRACLKTCIGLPKIASIAQ